jgi:hypothetical protein
MSYLITFLNKKMLHKTRYHFYLYNWFRCYCCHVFIIKAGPSFLEFDGGLVCSIYSIWSIIFSFAKQEGD